MTFTTGETKANKGPGHDDDDPQVLVLVLVFVIHNGWMASKVREFSSYR